MDPKILSIILPVFNGEKFISETIESLLNQTFSEFNLIIVNDGSNDKTLDIINSFTDHRIRIFNQENKGIIYAFNSVLKNIDTEFIARVDADDIYFKEKFAKQIEFMHANPDTVLLGTNAFYMSEKSEISSIKINVPIQNRLIMENLYNKKRALVQSTILARSEIVQKINGYRNNVYPEDYDLFFRISKYGNINNLEEPLASIRIHKSFSHKNLKMLINNHNELITKYNPHYSRQHKSSFLSIYLNRMSLYYYLNKSKIIAGIILLGSLLLTPIDSLRALLKKLR